MQCFRHRLFAVCKAENESLNLTVAICTLEFSSPPSDAWFLFFEISQGKHTATLVFLHGLGDTGHGWASSLTDIRTANTKIICPTAKTIPVTLNSGFPMPAWFDLMALDPDGPEDEKRMNASAQLVSNIITEEVAGGVPPERIILGGFSQGGALALLTALSVCKVKIGGVVALSCWLPLHSNFPKAAIHSDIPILQCHGDCDPVVPTKWGQMTSVLLKKFLKNHEFKTYRGLAHSSSDEEMKDVKDFIKGILKDG